MGKPIGAIVGPYKIESVQYRAQSVTTNKAMQEAVRGFGQAPTNYAIETAIDKVAAAVGLPRIEVRRRNFIRKEEFPYLIPSGSTYDSGDYHTVVDKVFKHADFEAMEQERDRLRASGMLAGIGIAACLEPSGGNSSFEPLLNEKNTTTTWMDSCRINIDALGFVTVTIHTTSSGQGHETLVGTVIGEVLQIDPDMIRVVRPDTLACLPSNSPVGSRMAIMLGGAAFHAAQKLKTKLARIAAHQFGCAEEGVTFASGAASDNAGHSLNWAELVNIAHRNYHLLPQDMEPGLEASHVMQVPTGNKLPENGRVQMYPCHSFEFHLVLLAIDPDLGKPEIKRYVIGHDCGVVINPHIVRGMTLGGIAHGLGATLLEEFVYDEQGHLITQSFMDYLLPSSHEMPEVEIVHHCTPSPHTVFGQKGSGESGYLGSPAAISTPSTMRFRRSEFPSTSFLFVFPRLVTPSPTPTRQTARASHMIIDCHAHLVPPSLIEDIKSQATKFPSVRLIEDGASIGFSFAGGKPTRPVSKPLSDLPGRLKWMDEQKIDRQVVAGWLDMYGNDLPAAEGAAWSRLINTHLAQTAKAEPRFVPLATVPTQDGKLAAKVLREAHAAGFKGVMIGTQTKGKGGVLDDPALDPFWEAANELGSIVSPHPVFESGDDRVHDYGMANAVGRVTDTMIAVSRMIYAGHFRASEMKFLALIGGAGLP